MEQKFRRRLLAGAGVVAVLAAGKLSQPTNIPIGEYRERMPMVMQELFKMLPEDKVHADFDGGKVSLTLKQGWHHTPQDRIMPEGNLDSLTKEMKFIAREMVSQALKAQNIPWKIRDVKLLYTDKEPESKTGRLVPRRLVEFSGGSQFERWAASLKGKLKAQKQGKPAGTPAGNAKFAKLIKKPRPNG